MRLRALELGRHHGSSTWSPVATPGSGMTFSDSSLAVNGKSVNIAAEVPSNSLRFYWAANGVPPGHR